MTSTPLFFGQERPDTCAIACLRMILAYNGIEVSEAELVRLTDLQDGGLTPAEVSRLARHYGLHADEEQRDHGRLCELINNQRFPVVFLFRGPIDRVDMIHAVIPLHHSRHRYPARTTARDDPKV